MTLGMPNNRPVPRNMVIPKVPSSVANFYIWLATRLANVLFSTNLVLKRTGPPQSIPPRISNLGMAEVENLAKMTIFPCFSALFQIYQADTSKLGH